MMKRIWSALFALVLILTMVPVTSVTPAEAAEGGEAAVQALPEEAAEPMKVGSSIETAEQLFFGRVGTYYWTTSNYENAYYFKFTTSERGKVDFYFTKPVDDNGNNGKLMLKLFKESSNNLVWETDSYYLYNDESDRYSFTFGLNPGTYYVLLKPNFIIRSGLFQTTYCFNFTATSEYEVEPNGTLGCATVLKHGTIYGANLAVCCLTGMNEDEDYFTFHAEAGHNYKIYVGNYSRFLNTTAMVWIRRPSETLFYPITKSDSNWDYDELGDYYLLKNAQSGEYYLHAYNYNRDAFPYTIGIFEPGETYTPPKITSQPSSVSVGVGDTATFTVKASGSGLNYQWQYRTSSSGSWNNTSLSGNKTSTLKVTAKDSYNGYQYRCVISNSYGTVSSSAATLTVVSKPSITTQPKSVTAGVGQTVSFTVKASGEGLSYQWQYRKSSTGTWRSSTMTGAKTATMSVSATTARNGYQYRCVVTNAAGSSTSAAATLTVDPKPRISKQPTAQTAACGTTAQFTVAAYGIGLQYQWQYKTATGTKWNNCTTTGAKTSALSVEATAARDGYQYRCRITDAQGNQIISSAAALHVSLGILTQPVSVSAPLDTTAKFTVKAGGGSGTLAYQWQYKSATGSYWNNCSMTGNKTAVLSVPVTLGRNGYQYRCKITDSSGSTVTSDPATLFVVTSITGQPADALAPVGSTAQFTVTVSGADLSYQWQYLSVGSTKWANCSMTGNKTATLSVPVTSARNGYQYRCRITDRSGAVIVSDPARLSVFCITSQPASVSAVVGTDAVFSVSTDVSGNGLSYQWQYRTSSTGTWRSSTMTGAKTDTMTVAATAARNGYQYRCTVTGSGGSVNSKAATLSVITLPTISTQPMTQMAGNGSSVNFTVEATGIGLTYQWQYRTSPDDPWTNSSRTDAKTSSLTVTVAPDRDCYQYRCAVSTAAGTVYSDVATLYLGHRFANSYESDSEVFWRLDDGVMLIMGRGAMPSVEVEEVEEGEAYIPEWFGARDQLHSVIITSGVTSVGKNAFRQCPNLTSVTIPDTVTSIEKAAFYYCSSLTSITIPDSVTTIASYAFSRCSSLTSVTIPDGVKTIGESAFYSCSSLTAINVSEDNANYSSRDGVLYNKDQTKLLQYPGGKTGAFIIPDSVTSFDRLAFTNCIGLTELTIPDSVTSFDSYAFENCSSLATITIGSGVTYISYSMFWGCTDLTDINVSGNNTNYSSADGILYNKTQTTLRCCPPGRSGSVTIPDSVTTIASYAFSGCSGLTSISIPDSVTTIASYAFSRCSGLTSISIPDSVTSLGGYLFSGCDSLESVTIGNGAYIFGILRVFDDCPGLKNIYTRSNNTRYSSEDGILYGNGITTLLRCPEGRTGSVSVPRGTKFIDDGAFAHCKGVTQVTLPDSVTKIDSGAFSGCSGLTDISIPGSVTTIGRSAFSGCSGLTSISIPDNVEEIQAATFSGCSGLTDVTIGSGVKSIFTTSPRAAFSGCSGLEAIYVSEDNSNYTAVDGLLYNKALTKLILCPYGKTGSVTLPDTVTSISTDAAACNVFQGCSALTDIYVSENHASYSSLNGVLYSKDKGTLIVCPAGKTGSVTIPDTVTSIGSYAFSGCSKLTGVTIGSSVTSIGDSAFALCRGLTELIIPDSVTTIRSYAFHCCTAVKSVTIGSGVKTIGGYAFNNCSAIEDVYYNGTAAMWKQISIQTGNNYLLNAERHYLQ